MDGGEMMHAFLENSPFARELGLELVTVEADRAEIRLPFREELATYGPVMHGGAIATTVDVAATVASFGGQEFDETPRGSTVGMTVNFVSAVKDSAITAHARVVRRGRSLVTVDVEVVDDDGQLAAKGLVTYKLG
jgi:uncharacterized protein (TIGR00369 family)